jgi:hypothetical protein
VVFELCLKVLEPFLMDGHAPDVFLEGELLQRGEATGSLIQRSGTGPSWVARHSGYSECCLGAGSSRGSDYPTVILI